MRLTRRRFHALTAGGLLLPGGLVGARAVAGAGAASRRRFIFVFCEGGWDQHMIFGPTFDSASIPDEPGATLADVGGVVFADHAARPSVRAFFEQHAARSCIINGVEVPSVSHDRCKQIVMTANTDAGHDDWAALLAGHAEGDPLLPCLVVSGPSYSAAYTPLVIRIGSQGQLSSLLDGSALEASVQPLPAPAAGAEGLLDDYVRGRVSRALEAAGEGRERAFMESYQGALDDLVTLREVADEVDLRTDDSGDLVDRLAPVLELFEAGMSRSATVRFLGMKDEGFDTHSSNERQSDHFELLFSSLSDLMDALAARPAPDGGSLADETVIAVLSEMGRTPVANEQGGKDHWTYTSAMLVGAGVRGGQVIGGYDEYGIGATTDLASGEVHDSGEPLTTEHLGATLLALGDVDPAIYLPTGAPISAITG